METNYYFATRCEHVDKWNKDTHILKISSVTAYQVRFTWAIRPSVFYRAAFVAPGRMVIDEYGKLETVEHFVKMLDEATAEYDMSAIGQEFS